MISHTSHHFSRTFMMRRGYARAATVRANNRQPVDRLTIDLRPSTSACRLFMFHLRHTAPDQIDEHILERRLALGQRDHPDAPRLEHTDDGPEHPLLLQD